jgi:hypothetical protein
MGLFKEIAEPLVSRGVPLIPLRPQSKIAFIQDWEKLATTDPIKVEEWDQQYPGANAACVAFAKPDGMWFLDIDSPGYAAQIESQTGNKMPQTFMVRSSPGKGHYYFKQTPASIQMGNAQGKDEQDKELWSARVDRRYVVAANSYHSSSGKRYEVLRDTEILPAPDWLVEWCVSNHKPAAKTGIQELDNDETIIAEGGRNSALASILGKARQVLSMDKQQLLDYGLSVNQKRCSPPLSETEVRTIANSIGSYAVKVNETTYSNGLVLSVGQPVQQVQQLDVLGIKPVPYPIFPRWVMKGTSLFEGLVGPVCAQNSRYPEFMFMPGVAVMLNYLAMKLTVTGKEKLVPSLFMISIGRKGRVIKSSSANDAIEYLQTAGIAAYAGAQTRNADGKAMVYTVGSPEGLGLEMTRTNCKNVVLFYDELSTLTNKAGIEGSSLATNLLSMYESGKFSNVIKSRRETYNFDPGTYCASLIACTTDQNFHKNWSKLAGGSSGLDERFFFLYQPEVLSPLTPVKYVNTTLAASETKKRLDKAVQQGVYCIDDETQLEEKINRIGNRVEIRAEKFALYFAVDLGLDSIDEGCIERALAICEYEIAVKKYLKTFEATTVEGSLQNELIQLLQRNGGRITEREMYRSMHPERHGTSLWWKVYEGLKRGGWIIEDGLGVKESPKTVVLMRLPESDEE